MLVETLMLAQLYHYKVLYTGIAYFALLNWNKHLYISISASALRFFATLCYASIVKTAKLLSVDKASDCNLFEAGRIFFYLFVQHLAQMHPGP